MLTTWHFMYRVITETVTVCILATICLIEAMRERVNADARLGICELGMHGLSS